MLLAFVSLILVRSSHPAYFYICPCLLLANTVTSLLRREFKLIWSGDVVSKFIDVNTGQMENLSEYKVKKSGLFNILKYSTNKNRNLSSNHINTTSASNEDDETRF